MPENPSPPSNLKKWIVAARPWALPASTMPVLYGTTLAFVVGNSRFSLFRFVLALAGMVLLHSAANMLSDIFDFKRGLDKEITPASGALVRGWLAPARLAGASAVLFIAGIAVGLVLVKLTGALLLIWIGAAGVAVGASYTFLKARALGDLAVFFNFGILGALGAYLVQKPYFSWIPVIWTVPMALLVMAILHANNWRDILSDRERKITTVAALLGDAGSLIYYGFLIFGPFAIILGLIIVPRIVAPIYEPMPWPSAAVLAALPQASGLWKRARRRHSPFHPMDFILLDGATARFNLVFGLILTASLWVQYLLETKFYWVY
jgi:1,4-dihydroxy-2-naphthoate octaprenyltransferase